MNFWAYSHKKYPLAIVPSLEVFRLPHACSNVYCVEFVCQWHLSLHQVHPISFQISVVELRSPQCRPVSRSSVFLSPEEGTRNPGRRRIPRIVHHRSELSWSLSCVVRLFDFECRWAVCSEAEGVLHDFDAVDFFFFRDFNLSISIF